MYSKIEDIDTLYYTAVNYFNKNTYLRIIISFSKEIIVQTNEYD